MTQLREVVDRLFSCDGLPRRVSVTRPYHGVGPGAELRFDAALRAYVGPRVALLPCFVRRGWGVFFGPARPVQTVLEI